MTVGPWHLKWQRHLASEYGAQLEVKLGAHRSDAVLGETEFRRTQYVELQSTYLPEADIKTREAQYGTKNLTWVYNCHWYDQLHWGPRGFWWKGGGARSMLAHRARIAWDTGPRLLVVKVKLVESWGGDYRIVGYVVDDHPSPFANPFAKQVPSLALSARFSA